MEEKERYEVMSPSLNGYAYIHDFKTDNVLNTYDSCDLLNKLDKENQQLKQQLHDLPKKIVEEIKDIIKTNYPYMTSIYDDNILFKSDLGIEMKSLSQVLETILKKFGGENG